MADVSGAGVSVNGVLEGGVPEGGVPEGGRRRHPEHDFRLLWAGETVSQVGSQVSTLALPLVAVITLHATVFEVGVLTAAGTLAFLLVGLPAGAWVDRLRRRPVLIAADLGRMLVYGSIPLSAVLGVLSMLQLYLVALLGGALTVFFDVAYQSYLPDLVGRQRLVASNARLQTSESLAQVIGPTLAGWLVQVFGGPYAVAVDAGSFIVSAGAVGAIRTAEPAVGGGRRGRGSLRREIGEGLRFVVRHPILRAIAGTTSTANLFSSIEGAVVIVFLVRTVHLRSAAIGLLFAFAAIGGVVGALSAMPLGRLVGGARVTIAGIAVGGLGTLLLPLTRPGLAVGLFAAGSFLNFFGAVVYNINQVSFRQALCPPELLGRMNATMRFIVWGTMPIGGIIGGVLGGAIGTRSTLWVSAAGSFLALVWLLASPLRTARDYPELAA